MKNYSLLFITVVLVCSTSMAWGENTPDTKKNSASIPLELSNTNGSSTPYSQALKKFMGIPFRVDGASDIDGNWVTFKNPHQNLSSPGFNCSGFTIAAVREMLGQQITLEDATRDRQLDSGPDSPLGQDWDFGLDLILNLAQNYTYKLLPAPPNPQDTPIDHSEARPLGWGVNIHSPELETVLDTLQPGTIILFAISRPTRKFGAGIAYYHVGIILPEPPHLWLYQTTTGARTNRIDLASPTGLARFQREFKPIPGTQRRLLLIELQ